jgi:glucose-6-phosphate 1-dehydrogenase
MRGDSTLFMRADQVESAWDILMPIISIWDKNAVTNFPNYEAGSPGPPEAEALIAGDGHNWIVKQMIKNDTGNKKSGKGI